MRILAALAIIFFGVLTASPAEARGGGRFGEEDKIYRIEPIQLPADVASSDVPPEWSGGVYLARRTVIHWFFLGAWMSDEEYVAVPASGGETYWKLGDEQLKALHDMGAISSAKPAYTIPLIDYAFAYSVWIALAALLGYFGISAWITNLRASGVRAAVGADFPAFMRQALINAAKEDGDIAEEELQTIASILKAAFNTDVTRLELVEEMADATLKSGQLVAHFKMSQRAMSGEQRDLLIKALVALFSADGQWTSKEKRLLQRYIVALGTEEKHASKLVNDVARGTAPA